MKDKIRQEILELLDIREKDNFSDIELFQLLDKKRKAVHPDRTTDDVVKKEYEEKVKLLNDLYKRFGEHIKASPDNNNNLQLYKGEIEFDYVSIKLENDELKGKVQSLETEIYLLKSSINKKNETIKRLNDVKIKEETEKLKEIYKPKRSNLIIFGISVFLSSLLYILSQTQEAIAIYTKYLPMLSPLIINMITLGILLFVSFILLINFIKKGIIQQWAEKVKSTEFKIQLFDFVKENTEPKGETSYDFSYRDTSYSFKERVIYNFISNFFAPKNKIVRFFRFLIGFRTYQVFENFKNIVIYELINKEIITIYGNSGFDKILKYEE